MNCFHEILQITKSAYELTFNRETIPKSIMSSSPSIASKMLLFPDDQSMQTSSLSSQDIGYDVSSDLLAKGNKTYVPKAPSNAKSTHGY